MEFFDSLITDVECLITDLKQGSYDYVPEKAWCDVGYNQVVLQRDTLFELDGIGMNLVTSAAVSDGITVVGADLNEINTDTEFARIAVIQLDCDGDEQEWYNLIRKIEYTKYHYFPDGYMIRTSSRSHKEVVRVSRSAVKEGIDFQKVGSLLINKFKENKSVKAVRVIFVTGGGADFKRLEAIAVKNNDITEALNHVINSVNFDCSTCNLKAVCDEVEGMKELHFKNSMV